MILSISKNGRNSSSVKKNLTGNPDTLLSTLDT